MKITCDKDQVDFNFIFNNINGYDNSPLCFIVWKMPERRNIKKFIGIDMEYNESGEIVIMGI